MAIKNPEYTPVEARSLFAAEVAGAAVYAASALSLFAAMVHLWVAPGHFEEWWAYGAFFLAAAGAQGFFAVALLRWPGRLLSFAGIVGNLAIISLYVVTRTAGPPLGPHAGRAEEAGLLDMATTAAELGIAVFLLSLLGGRERSLAINLMLLLGAAIWGLRLTGFLS